ncbi:MAG: hypothetical protein IJ702_08055 [Fretibacterium sp.]|nr:hypothetical protein [Fretibacterium sp.]
MGKMSSYFEEQQRKAVEEAVQKAVQKAEARAAKAEAKAEKKAQENIALRLIQLGKDTLDDIAECTGLTLRRVKTLARAASA